MIEKGSFADITSKFVSETTSHGIPRIAAAKSWYGRLLWSLLFLGCMGVFVWQAYLLINAYMGYHVSISINVNNIVGREIDFPAVTVCNTNPVRKTRIQSSSHFVLADLEKYSQGLPYYAPCKNEDYICENNKCVKGFKVCNGIDDCGDYSDETKCALPQCGDNYFICTSGSKMGWCIKQELVCNRSPDCYEGEDELTCLQSDITCTANEFKCKEGIHTQFYLDFLETYGTPYCIGGQYECDGVDHCGDGDDEEACIVEDCDGISCGNNHCIPTSWQCDAMCDCPDCRDEQTTTCPFVCNNSNVVSNYVECNYIDDCGDNSDEENCQFEDCLDGFFACANRECMPIHARCDYEINCLDGSDEIGCNCTGFACDDGTCVNEYAWCNTVAECADGSDEAMCNETTFVYPTISPQTWTSDWYADYVSILQDTSQAEEVFEGQFPTEYTDWGFERITGEFPPDWIRFIAFSNTPDFSDLQGVLKLESHETAEFGHQQAEFILQCSYDKKGCIMDHFQQFQHDKYGNCYTFNSGKPVYVPWTGAPNESLAFESTEFVEEYPSIKTSSLPGAGNGLKLTLNVEQTEYISIFGQDSGVKVSIHRQHETPFPEDNAITLSPGRSTSIGIRMNEYIRLGEPYGNCTSDLTEDMTLVFPHDTVYTVTGCQKACLQRVLWENCACVDTMLIDNVNRCRILDYDQERCRQLINFLHRTQKTDCACHIPCSEIGYAHTISQSLWPSESYITTLLESIYAISQTHRNHIYDMQTAKQNLVRLEVYYEDLSYISISESPAYSWESLFGDIGGTLGLYIGLSMLTVVEFIEFAIDISMYIFNKLFKRNKVAELKGGI